MLTDDIRNKMVDGVAAENGRRLSEEELDRVAARVAARLRRPRLEVPKHVGPTPFCPRIAATAVELEQLDAELETARSAWFDRRDAIRAAHDSGEGSHSSFPGDGAGGRPVWHAPAALLSAAGDAEHAMQQVERRLLRVRSRLTALQLSRDHWRAEQL